MLPLRWGSSLSEWKMGDWELKRASRPMLAILRRKSRRVWGWWSWKNLFFHHRLWNSLLALWWWRAFLSPDRLRERCMCLLCLTMTQDVRILHLEAGHPFGRKMEPGHPRIKKSYTFMFIIFFIKENIIGN